MKQIGIGVSLALLAVTSLSGCGMTRASQRAPDPVAIVRPVPPEKLAPRKGSIWQTSIRNSLFEDNKARYVGDIVRVRISENSTSKSNAKSELKKEGNLGFGLTNPNLDSLLQVNPNKGVSLAGVTGNANSTSTGDGKNERNATLKAVISCVVTEVLANGNLRVEGRRDITIDNENQYIIISGIVRPEDIDAENAISSEMIADARIEYSGEGDISDLQRPNMIFRALSTIGIM